MSTRLSSIVVVGILLLGVCSLAAIGALTYFDKTVPDIFAQVVTASLAATAGILARTDDRTGSGS